MNIFSEANIRIFSIFAVLFAISEFVAYVVKIEIGLTLITTFYLDIITAILLPVVVIGEFLVILWEQNKITVSHYPFSIMMQDLGGDHYGIYDDSPTPESSNPTEGKLRVMIQKKGHRGGIFLGKMNFETRDHFTIRWVGDSVVSIKGEQRSPKDGFLSHTFVFDRSELKEDQAILEFTVQRSKVSRLPSLQPLFLEATVEYHLRLFSLNIPAMDKSRIGVILG